MKKLFAVVLVLALVFAVTGCKKKDTLKVGATPTPHAEILEIAKEQLKKEGIELEIIEFTDYVQPNTSLEDGSLDANYFQHMPYLTSFNEEQGTHLASACYVHYEPFGVYPGKAASFDELTDGSQIAVPNDTTNEARALQLLQQEGLITLKDGVGLNATKLDIIDNPKNLEIVEMEAAQLSHVLKDVDLAVINGNYAIDAGLSVAKDAIAVEDKDSEAADTFANILAVREGEEKDERIQKLVKALQSEEVRKFIEDTYDGAVIPKF